MATMFIRHRVADYKAWRKVYDEMAPIQKRLGVQAEAVYQTLGDPRELTVTHDFATAEAAQAFAGSTELREAMHSAGVEGAPSIWFATRS